jgi:4-hydroxybenzoyl-CoA thioesterase
MALPLSIKIYGLACALTESYIPLTNLENNMSDRHHVFRYRIAYSDCDPAQIVFFANYFKWFDTASREYFTACGILSWHQMERDRGIIGTPLVNAQANFLAPATYGEDIEIESFIESWKTTSFVMQHIAKRGDVTLAEGREVRVFAVRDSEDPSRIKAIPIPKDFKIACS